MNKSRIGIGMAVAICVAWNAGAAADTTPDRYELKITPEFHQDTFVRGTPMLFKVVLADRQKQKYLNTVQQAKALNLPRPEFTNEVAAAFEVIDWRHLHIRVSSVEDVFAGSATVLASNFVLVSVQPEKPSDEDVSWGELRRQATYGVSPEFSATFGAGEYIVSAVFMSGSIAVTSAAIRVMVVEKTADQRVIRENKYRAARYYLLRNDPSAAVKELAQHMNQNPDDQMGLSLLAQAQESSGDEVRAIESYQEYMRRFFTSGDASEARSIMQGKIQRLQRAVSLKHAEVSPPSGHE